MDKLLSMLGMAKRAGKVTSGGFQCERAVREHTARLVIIAEDAADNIKKSISDACCFHKVQYIVYSDTESLGRSIGAGLRAVISVNDVKFADAISVIYSKVGKEW